MDKAKLKRADGSRSARSQTIPRAPSATPACLVTEHTYPHDLSRLRVHTQKSVADRGKFEKKRESLLPHAHFIPHKIYAEVLDAGSLQHSHSVIDILKGMCSAAGLQQFGVKRLHTHAHPIDSQVQESLETLLRVQFRLKLNGKSVSELLQWCHLLSRPKCVVRSVSSA